VGDVREIEGAKKRKKEEKVEKGRDVTKGKR
jgi:hypothetical protein